MSDYLKTYVSKLPAFIRHLFRVGWLTLLILAIVHFSNTSGAEFLYWDQ